MTTLTIEVIVSLACESIPYIALLVLITQKLFSKKVNFKKLTREHQITSSK